MPTPGAAKSRVQGEYFFAFFFWQLRNVARYASSFPKEAGSGEA